MFTSLPVHLIQLIVDEVATNVSDLAHLCCTSKLLNGLCSPVVSHIFDELTSLTHKPCSPAALLFLQKRKAIMEQYVRPQSRDEYCLLEHIGTPLQTKALCVFDTDELTDEMLEAYIMQFETILVTRCRRITISRVNTALYKSKTIRKLNIDVWGSFGTDMCDRKVLEWHYYQWEDGYIKGLAVWWPETGPLAPDAVPGFRPSISPYDPYRWTSCSIVSQADCPRKTRSHL
jgi:hypothetical protein